MTGSLDTRLERATAIIASLVTLLIAVYTPDLFSFKTSTPGTSLGMAESTGAIRAGFSGTFPSPTFGAISPVFVNGHG